MGKIFVLLGKSGSGKSTIQQRILRRTSLKNVVSCTTRPMRSGEVDGEDYHYISNNTYNIKLANNEIISPRQYTTVYGVWSYGILKEAIDSSNDYLCVVDCDGYLQLTSHYGKENVVGIYITLQNRTRLVRSILRCSGTDEEISEIVRRYTDDNIVFSGIENSVSMIIENDILDETVDAIVDFIRSSI